MTKILRTLIDLGRADKKAGLLAQTDNGVLGLHLDFREGEREEALQARCPCDICAQPAFAGAAWQAASFQFQCCQYIMTQILCALSPNRWTRVQGNDLDHLPIESSTFPS